MEPPARAYFNLRREMATSQIEPRLVVHTESTGVDPLAGTSRDAVNAVRFLAADMVEHARSGHPGTPMALAPLAYRLYTKWLRHDPVAPDWFDRDRVVLSIGHASTLLYSSLHLAGYDVEVDDLRSFRRFGSRTPGHPERGETPGIDISTGPLGQGVANGVGFAITERMLAARYNRPDHTVMDHRTWVIAGDGDMMEGISSEAASLGGRLGLGKLTVWQAPTRLRWSSVCSPPTRRSLPDGYPRSEPSSSPTERHSNRNQRRYGAQDERSVVQVASSAAQLFRRRNPYPSGATLPVHRRYEVRGA